MSSDVGERIKQERLRQKISQNKLAQAAGIGQTTLSAIESSTKSPNVDTIRLLASALGCSVAELLGEAPPARLREDQTECATGEEAELLGIWRQLSSAGQNIILATARATLQQEGMRKAASM